MKVQLIVVQGKPEGKVIPLAGSLFKIGRGEGCQLRPNSELVSREHAEFRIEGEKVAVRDMGSRNGTLVNNKVITGLVEVRNGDLVQVGPLTFAVSIQGAPQPVAKPAPAKGASLDGVSGDQIDSWLIGDQNNPAPGSSSELYRGDTMTFNAFKTGGSGSTAKPEPTPAPAPAPTPPAAARPAPPKPAPAAEPEPIAEYVPDDDADEEELDETLAAQADDENENEEENEDEIPEEFVDESNPFYVAKKKANEPSADAAKQEKDSSEAAGDILRRLMERRRAR